MQLVKLLDLSLAIGGRHASVWVEGFHGGIDQTPGCQQGAGGQFLGANGQCISLGGSGFGAIRAAGGGPSCELQVFRGARCTNQAQRSFIVNNADLDPCWGPFGYAGGEMHGAVSLRLANCPI